MFECLAVFAVLAFLAVGDHHNRGRLPPTPFEAVMLRYCSERAEDVAAASAAYLLNILPGIVASNPSEGFRRLSIHIQTAIMAYINESEGFCVPEPSEN